MKAFFLSCSTLSFTIYSLPPAQLRYIYFALVSLLYAPTPFYQHMKKAISLEITLTLSLLTTNSAVSDISVAHAMSEKVSARTTGEAILKRL